MIVKLPCRYYRVYRWDTRAATEICIREVETKYAWSTTTEAFVTACGQAGR